MKNNSEVLDKFKAISAKRLTEVMLLKNTDRTSIRRVLENEYGYIVQRQTYDKYQRAVNSMPKEFIEKVSEILGIEKGYLFGNDNFVCDTYAEYLDYMNLMSDSNFTKYDSLLKYADLGLSSELNINNEQIMYNLSSFTDKSIGTKTFSLSDMENFCNIICQKIIELFKDYVSLDDLPVGGSVDEWLHFLKWHKDFFNNSENMYFLSSEAKQALDILKEGDAND